MYNVIKFINLIGVIAMLIAKIFGKEVDLQMAMVMMLVVIYMTLETSP